MKKISTIEFSASLESIRTAASTGTIPPELLEPLQSLVTALAGLVAQQPTGVYLLSSDDNKELRDLFGACLATALLPHVKTTLLVDSDFLNVGMGDIVPQKDSLGFLDLLLYGSSMKAIVQRAAGGFFVIGAGSFQVTKKLPFTIESFQSAVRYLLNQAQCVIFSGPAEDDTGTVQPMAESLNTIIYVRQVARSGGIPADQFETKLTPLDDANLFAVSVVLDAAQPRAGMPTAPVLPEKPETPPVPPEKPEAAEPGAEPELRDSAGAHEQIPAGERGEPGRPGRETESAEGRSDARDGGGNFYTWDTIEEPRARGGKNSLFAKIAMGIIPVILVAFLFWWLFYTKSYRSESEQPVQGETQPVAALVDSADAGGSAQPVDTFAAAMEAPAGEESTETVPAAVPDAVEESVERQGTPVVTEPAGTAAPVYDSLAPIAGKYLIHISSFRMVDHAKDDAQYLLDKGFRVCVARVDLGAKGEWYRVYGGPYDTRDEARDIKMRLENLDRVKFTRITKAP